MGKKFPYKIIVFTQTKFDTAIRPAGVSHITHTSVTV